MEAVEATVEVVTEVPVTYWEFSMVADGRDDVPDSYYMGTLEDDSGRLWVGFTPYERELRDGLEFEDLEGYCRLVLPWSLFARAARRILGAKDGATIGLAGNGMFAKDTYDGTTWIQYTTACGENYFLSPEELEALLS